MLDAVLSGSTFWLSADGQRRFKKLAELWSGSGTIEELPFGALRWSRRTAVTFAGHAWFSSPPMIEGDAYQAFIPLGQAGDVAAYAFLTPFSSIRASFASALHGELFEKWGFPERGGFVLDEPGVRSLLSEEEAPGDLIEAEFQDEAAQRVLLDLGEPDWEIASDPDLRLTSLLVSAGEHNLRLHRDFSFELDGISDDCVNVAISVQMFFGSYARFALPAHAAARSVSAASR